MTLFGKLINPSARPRAIRKKSTSSYQAVAEMAGALIPSVNVPMRLQREWLVMFLAGVMIAGLVAGLYLNVTARAAIAGREIQSIEAQIAVDERANADLQTQIATQLSYDQLYRRAVALGFEPLSRDNVEYMVVPGYFPQQTVEFSQPAVETDVLASSPEFSESLFDWIGRQIEAASRPLN